MGLVAARLTNAAELTALLAALTWRATLPEQVRARILFDSKVSIDLVEQRSRASTTVTGAAVSAGAQSVSCLRIHRDDTHALAARLQCNEIADAWQRQRRMGLPGWTGAGNC